MKKTVYFCLFPLAALLFAACPPDGDKPTANEPSLVVKTGKVTFVNESGYKVVVHQDAFSGPVLLELSAGESKRIDVRTSDNYGIGSTFSIEYVLQCQIVESIGGEIREVPASAIDPNVQINRVIEEEKSYTIQIPQPKNLKPRSAFICIVNGHNLPFELRYLGTAFRQADNNGNGAFPVPPYKTGIYKLPLGTEGSIPDDGRLYQNYEAVSTFASVTVPDFTVKNGIRYNFIYDGTKVEKDPQTPEVPLVF
jgi:hypothetical protein